MSYSPNYCRSWRAFSPDDRSARLPLARMARQSNAESTSVCSQMARHIGGGPEQPSRAPAFCCRPTSTGLLPMPVAHGSRRLAQRVYRPRSGGTRYVGGEKVRPENVFKSRQIHFPYLLAKACKHDSV